MKTKLKLLLVLAVVPLGLVASACRAEAEETNPAEAAAPAESAAAEAEAGEPEAGDAAPASGETTESGETNVVINQEITVLQEVPPTTPPNLNLSKGVDAIVKLAQSGVSETVILTFIETTEHEYNLDAPAILYLNDIGISSNVIAAMLNHDGAPEDLKDLLDEKTELAEAAAEAAPDQAPVEPISRSILNGGFGATQAAAAPVQEQAPVEVTTNYVATEAQSVIQQPVVVEQPVVVQQPVVYTQPAVAHSYFYSSLAPYGSWIYVSDYGWCWQPTVAVTYSGWRPYTHGGRWLDSDAGWYWQSDYSWGWAPFHYGRWFSSPHRGWVWVPDYTWGPSWVTWRRSPYYCGWAPLPPRAYYRPGFGFSYFGRSVGVNFSFGLGYEHYSFVHKRNFCDRRLVHHVLPTARTINVYKDSTIINNYVVGNDNTIINRGVDRDLIARHARTEIPKVGIRNIPPDSGRLVQPDRLRKQGSDLVVYRPAPPSPSVAAAAASRQEVRRGVANDLAANSRSGRTVPAVSTTTGGPASFSPRAEVSRGSSGNLAAAAAPSSRQSVAARNPAAATWAKPAPFVPPAETAAPVARTSTRREIGRNSASPVSTRGLVSTSPAATPAPVGRGSTVLPPSRSAITPGATAPSSRSTMPAVRPSVPAGSGSASVGPSERANPWASRSEAIARTPSATAPAQAATTPTAPSTQSRLESFRRSAPAIGNSPVPGANIGTTTSRASSWPSRTVTPAPAQRAVTPAPAPRTVTPSHVPAQIPRTTFQNPITVRPAPAQAPPAMTSRAQSPLWNSTATRPAQVPNTTVTVPQPRTETFNRPTVVPPPTARAVTPSYQTRTVTPVPSRTQPSSRFSAPARVAPPANNFRSAPAPTAQPSFRSAPAPAAQPSFRSAPTPAPQPSFRAPAASSSPPAATGRGRMEIRR